MLRFRFFKRLSKRAKVIIFSLTAAAIIYYLSQNVNSHDGTVIESEMQIEPVCTEPPKKPDPKLNVVYRNKYWQVATSNTFEEIVVYSAFYDNRKIIGEIPVIRIHGVLSLNRLITESRVFCQIWFDGVTNSQLIEAEIKVTGADYDVLHNKEPKIYGTRLYSCSLSNADERYPTHVSLTIAKSCITATNLIPIKIPSPITPTWKHEFAVCVQSSFGCFNSKRLIEWFEAYRMFGVTRFNIYNGSICSDLNPIFKYYSNLGKHSSQNLEKSNTKQSWPAAQQKGDSWVDAENEDAMLSFRQLPPSVSHFGESEFRLSSEVSLNDCYLRHMHNTRFVVIVDYDEIIVPRLHENYRDMIKHIDKTLNMNESYHSYAFRNTFFFEDLPIDNTQPKHLRTLTYRHHVPPSDMFVGCKSFVDTERCLSVFNNYCRLRFPDSPAVPAAVDVDKAIARSHHYRYKCPFEQEMCDSLAKQKNLDDTMIKFKDTLLQRVNRVLGELNIKL